MTEEQFNSLKVFEHFIAEWKRHGHLSERNVFCLSFMIHHGQITNHQVSLNEALDYTNRYKVIQR